MMGDFFEVLNFNQLFLKLNQFIYNYTNMVFIVTYYLSYTLFYIFLVY